MRPTTDVDVVALVDGRPELVDEIEAAGEHLRRYVATEIGRRVGDPRALDAVAAHLEFGGGGAARAEAVVGPRLRRMSGDAA